LLADLEPKDATLRALLLLFSKKKMYRKQIQGVLEVLLDVDLWLDALAKDQNLCEGLPAELSTILEQAKERAAARPAKVEESSADNPIDGAADVENAFDTMPLEASVDATGYSSTVVAETQVEGVAADAIYPTAPPTDSAIRRAADRAREYAQESAEAKNRCRVSIGGDTLALLDQACGRMAEINYRAADRDAAEVFEMFRNAVMRIVSSRTKDDDEELDRREPKDLVLAFLLDVHERQRRFRSQVKSIFVRLWDFTEWRAAIQQDPSVLNLVRSLIGDAAEGDDLAGDDAKVPSLSDLAAVAESRGCIGILEVHVIAARNLVDKPGVSDPYTRVTLGPRTRITETIMDDLNPRWKCGPLRFEVPSIDSSVLFEVLHEKSGNDETLGRIALQCSDVADVLPRQLGAPKWHKLIGVPHGELQIDLAFEPGESLLEECVTREDSFHSADDDAATWIRMEGLPHNEGDTASMWTSGIRTFEDMQRACEKDPGCVGFAYCPATQQWTPKQKGTGFDPSAARYSQKWSGQVWEWHYIEQRAPKAVPAHGEQLQDKARQSDDAARFVVWISTDPRNKGNPVPYPTEISMELEFAYSAGDEQVDVSKAIPGASVSLTQPFQQRTTNGSRSVSRCPMVTQGGEITVYVDQAPKGGWKLAADPTFGEPRSVRIPPEFVIHAMEKQTPERSRGHAYPTRSATVPLSAPPSSAATHAARPKKVAAAPKRAATHVAKQQEGGCRPM
jgi:hypothetical protein